MPLSISDTLNMPKKKKIPLPAYINSSDKRAAKMFALELSKILEDAGEGSPIIVLCIGTDRVTGDSLGPLVGYKLKNSLKGAFVYGTLDEPVHAKNLSHTIREIYTEFKNPFIIAIDACLGSAEHIGYVTVGKGPVKPGAGVDKKLPEVGDAFVTGIVNYCGSLGAYDNIILQNTRLNVVMQLADLVSYGIKRSLAEVVRRG